MIKYTSNEKKSIRYFFEHQNEYLDFNNALIWIDPLGLHETLSDNDIVCRGDTCKAENFKKGSGVRLMQTEN